MSTNCNILVPWCFGRWADGQDAAERECSSCQFLKRCHPVKAEKHDTNKPKLSLIGISYWDLVMSQQGKEHDWCYVACCRILEACHKTTEAGIRDGIVSAILRIQQEFGPLEVLSLTAQAMEYGIGKYGRNNWKKGMEWSRLADAALRHLSAVLVGEDYFDEESGLSHLAHGLASLHMLLGNIDMKIGTNDLLTTVE